MVQPPLISPVNWVILPIDFWVVLGYDIGVMGVILPLSLIHLIVILIMESSNLSKIKPKFRTSGAVTGNFGKMKVKAGSQMQAIGYGGVGSMPSLSKQFELFLSIWPRMSVRWRRNMLPILQGWGATLNRLPQLNLTVRSYDY